MLTVLDPIRHPRLFHLPILWERLKAKFTALAGRKGRGGPAADCLLRASLAEAAAQVGATVVELGHQVLEIRLGERWTRVCNNVSAIDDLAAHHIVAHQRADAQSPRRTRLAHAKAP